MIVIAMLAALTSTGCTSQPTVPTLSADPADSSSSLKRDQAQSLWNGYLLTYTRLAGSSSADLADLRPYVTSAEYVAVEAQLKGLRSKDVALQGRLSSRNFQLQSADGQLPVVATVCVDTGSSKFVSSGGSDVTPSGRQRNFTLRLEFAVERGALRLDKDEVWTKSSAC